MSRNAKDPRINQIVVSGRLTRDPEMRHSTKGTSYVKVGLACDGWGKEAPPTFYNLTVFGKAAEAAEELRKGDLVMAIGRHDGSEYEHNGEKRRRNDIACNEIRALAWPEEAPQSRGDTRVNHGVTTSVDEDVPF